jgi:hypothetical protein
LPVQQKYNFTDLYNGLTGTVPYRPLAGAFEVAEACLKFATSETRGGYQFDSAAWPRLAGQENLWNLVPPTVLTGFSTKDLKAIADAIGRSREQPLAAWGMAKRISTAVSEDFAASEPYDDEEYTLKDLQGFAVPADSVETLLGSTNELSAQLGADYNRYDPSAVNGLKLWRDEPFLHGRFIVTVDKTCGAQFDAAIGDDDKLKIALIQPNQSLLELSVTMVSPKSESDTNPRFFGVGPRCAKAQTKKVLKGLKLAAAAGAGIALLPELVMTEAAVKKVAAELGTPGNIIATSARPHTLRAVVSGSYHHVELDGSRKIQRNSTQVHFPRPNPMQRQHSKSGMFEYAAPQAVMEAWKSSQWIFHWPAVFALIRHGLSKEDKHGPPPIIKFREDVESTREIRLFAGAEFSVVVVICADLLDPTFRRVLETLQPSLVLVCNMTPKQGDFAAAAHALILACQSTLVAVNNPAKWSKSGGISGIPVEGGMAGLPVRDENERVKKEHVPFKKILIFDPVARQFQAYPR